ncbi:D-alanyl-D-alanine carboxypeptidase-like protein [Isoptericola sp. CG 20/1183]|uniref:D-alanyl-D-alanine carboxypeptidase-like protein n=1 Tax=Isoptericola halotolerans TaxID=300560 RepID=A0ABX5EH52_9MICO|nr:MULTISPECIES: M15 family metallopeptidase [Isoptericola]PRZ08655.1 D-alanyl-D-alanine carboxypeptidase-like protein [Isoptericola halotolerans]PRZ10898.1 D-alanyl-D-alanine carboxypeptidase-like protein [Isoptericola sp. CG 20/1183]
MAVEKNGDLGERDAHGVDGSVPRRATPAQRVHPMLRTLGAGAAALTLAAGIMAGSVADLPWNDFAEHPAFSAPVEADPVVVGVVGASTSTGPTTLGQLLDIVERAELAAVDSGRALDPEVQQAAAELGSLLSIYVAQRDAAVAPRAGAPEQRDDVAGPVPGDTDTDEPAAPDPADEPGQPDGGEPIVDPDLGDGELRPPAEADEPAGDDGGSVRPQDVADVGTPQVEYSDATQDDADEPRPTAELEPIEPVDVPSLQLPTLDELLDGDGTGDGDEALRVASPVLPDDAGAADEGDPSDRASAPEVPGTPSAGPDATDGPDDEAHGAPDGAGHEHVHDAVTFDDVVVAATRLSTLLDPASAGYVVDIRPPVTELADGTFVLNDGTPATADGLPLDAVTSSLSAALRSVVDQHASSTAGYSNGMIPASVLCAIPWAPGHMLRCDAALQLEALNEEYRARFGTDIPITDSYRSYAAQVAVRAAKPHLAAVPGTSNHGWGLALDLSTPISGGRSAEYAWLRVNGPDYGWDNPAWARLDGSKPEPWHFEFFAAGPIPDRATSTDDFDTDGGASTGGSATGGSSGGGSKGGAGDGQGAGGGSADSKDGKKKDGGTNGTGDKTGTGGKGGKDGGDSKPSPSPKPSPKPSPGPSEPSEPSPTPKPSPSPSPKPTPEPSPSTPPEPTPTPEPSEPEPEPTETTEPAEPTEPTDPTQEPAPEPTKSAPTTTEPTSEPTSTALLDPALELLGAKDDDPEGDSGADEEPGDQ